MLTRHSQGTQGTHRVLAGIVSRTELRRILGNLNIVPEPAVLRQLLRACDTNAVRIALRMRNRESW